MFRISSEEAAGSRVLRLEGWLDADALPVLDEALADAPRRTLVLDLSALRGIDGAAAIRLAALRSTGVPLRAGSAFVEKLIAHHAS
jgi:anti-anti-sigma regulatory factor